MAGGRCGGARVKGIDLRTRDVGAERWQRGRIVQYCVRRMHAVLTDAQSQHLAFLAGSRSKTVKDDAEFYEQEAGNILLLASFLGAQHPWLKKAANQFLLTWLRDPATVDPATILLAAKRTDCHKHPTIGVSESCAILRMLRVRERGEPALEEYKALFQKRIDWTRATAGLTLQWIRSLGGDNIDVSEVIDVGDRVLESREKPVSLIRFDKRGLVAWNDESKVYYVTHLIYVASTYGATRIPPSRPLGLYQRVTRKLLRQIAARALAPNLELALELGTCLLILGLKLDDEDRRLLSIIRAHLVSLFRNKTLEEWTQVQGNQPGTFPNAFFEKNLTHGRRGLHIEYHTAFLVALFILLHQP